MMELLEKLYLLLPPAVIVSLHVAVAFILLTFTVSTATQNYSQVDKLWSVLPPVFACILVNDARTLLMAIVAVIWGTRLTYNFARRGGYAWPPWEGEEDYRWEYIRRGHFWKPLSNPVVWHTFNLLFISIYQIVLLYLIAAPSVVAHMVARSGEPSPLTAVDAAAAFLVLLCVWIESVADQQQYAFQTQKYGLKKAKKQLTGDYAKGFCTSGLFSIVRKPNYAAEQAVWISYYLFSISIDPLNWCIVGCILLCLLFQGSGWLTEKMSMEKYPAYREYRRQVPLYVPGLYHLWRPHYSDVSKSQ